MIKSHTKGYIAGILAAIFYGTNPLGALPLYERGITSGNVLFYRYGLTVLMLAAWLLLRKETFGVKWGHAIKFAILGSFFGFSSIMLFASFHFMNAGVASTILFSYPIITAILMVVFYHERLSWRTTLSILLAVLGIGLLYRGDGGETLSPTGILLVLGSSFLYALYIVYVNQFKTDMSPVKFTFWIIFFGWLTIIGYMLFIGDRLQMLCDALSWLCTLQLALLATLLSLYYINIAIQHIGSTQASILGALEPVTAVVISTFVFGEIFTFRLAIGIVLILSAVILIILKK
ncbi:DMT family transporter [Prevotella brunnea]|uniref:DMT family transporter n=1 Tax=Prevotella brunnea TaxID=2508867 RepID=A0A5C8GI60_9BACT|nr:DMT family transporter [Prevotella brunnea]MDR0185722.1 DMT family transporter [Prevotella brunnea]TXJ61627.1 DMT family transporter [Prevotella brunnea]